MDWTDAKREEVVTSYKDAEPTPDNTMDIIKQIAEDIDASANGVRTILIKAGVYIKKTPSVASTSTDKPKTTRVNKADQQLALTNLIESLGKEADQDIIEKLTGKAAAYLVEVFTQDA